MLTPHRLTLLPLLVTLTLAACAPGQRLYTTAVERPPAEGRYHLLLHGCNYGNDPNTIAFFWPTTQPYTFAPYSPAFQYQLRENLPLAEARRQAQSFVNCSPHFETARLRAITGPFESAAAPGPTIGYELRPLYTQPSPFRQADMLNVSYHQTAPDIIRIYITPLTDVDVEDQDNQ